jgi:hypothetical protein
MNNPFMMLDLSLSLLSLLALIDKPYRWKSNLAAMTRSKPRITVVEVVEDSLTTVRLAT